MTGRKDHAAHGDRPRADLEVASSGPRAWRQIIPGYGRCWAGEKSVANLLEGKRRRESLPCPTVSVSSTPAGGRITAQVERVGQRCQLAILNTGCELGEEEIARVFDRFWRADAARSKSGLNCGLGLTLVRRAMEAMGGRAAANTSDDGCFILSLTLDAGEPGGSAGPAASCDP
jgi:hypothetical protein